MNNLCEKIILKDNLISNINIIKKIIGNKKFCAVVKADAYGCGVENIVPTIANYVDYFAVANFIEAKAVKLYTHKPVLILGEVEKQNILPAIENDILLSVGSGKKLYEIYNIAKKNNKVAKIHFKINTGMNRLGFNNLNNFVKVYKKYRNCKYISYGGIFSHIARQNNDDEINKQKKKFETFINTVDSRNLIKHLSSTTVALSRKDCIYDMCRIGIGMYNYARNNEFGLKPILEIKTKIINILNVKKGEYIGYEYGYKANKDIKIAVIPIGYADGYNRLLSNNAKIIINGEYADIVGNICMDMCFCDITTIKCKINDSVIVVGKQADKEINFTELAEICKTIDYELLTNFKSDRINVCIK